VKEEVKINQNLGMQPIMKMNQTATVILPVEDF